MSRQERAAKAAADRRRARRRDRQAARRDLGRHVGPRRRACGPSRDFLREAEAIEAGRVVRMHDELGPQ